MSVLELELDEAVGFGKIALAVSLSKTATLGATSLSPATAAFFIVSFGEDVVPFLGFGSSTGAATSIFENFCIAIVSV